MIHVMRFRSKKTFIYDETKNERKINQQHFSFTQNTIHSEGLNNLVFQNMSQSQYGRHMDIDVPFTNVNNNSYDRSFGTDQYFSI